MRLSLVALVCHLTNTHAINTHTHTHKHATPTRHNTHKTLANQHTGFKRSTLTMMALDGAAKADDPLAAAKNWFDSILTSASTAATAATKSRRTAIITGASSGLGKQATRALAESGNWHVVMACRSTDKAQAVADELGLDPASYSVMELDLANLNGVRSFAEKFLASGRPLDCLCCNAAVYLPNQPEPSFTVDGYEESMQVNHLGHFLLVNLLLDHVAKSVLKRVVVVGSVTGNTNTLAGGFVWPRAELGKLQGFDQGFKNIPMADGKEFNGAKAYKDAKLCNMLTVNELHRRYHESKGVTFSSLYPGCIADTELFRQKRQWFRVWFPAFQKYVIGGYVSEAEAGDRLATVCASEECSKSGVYWSWNGKAQGVGLLTGEAGFKPSGAGGSGGSLFEGELSSTASDVELGRRVWEYSEDLVGL